MRHGEKGDVTNGIKRSLIQTYAELFIKNIY